MLPRRAPADFGPPRSRSRSSSQGRGSKPSRPIVEAPDVRSHAGERPMEGTARVESVAWSRRRRARHPRALISCLCAPGRCGRWLRRDDLPEIRRVGSRRCCPISRLRTGVPARRSRDVHRPGDDRGRARRGGRSDVVAAECASSALLPRIHRLRLGAPRGDPRPHGSHAQSDGSLRREHRPCARRRRVLAPAARPGSDREIRRPARRARGRSARHLGAWALRLAAALLGFGAAAKFYPAFLLPIVAIAALRSAAVARRSWFSPPHLP